MPPAIHDRYCSACGAAFEDTSRYPRSCPSPACGRQAWANPIPVGVAIVPVVCEARLGVLVVRRSIPPQAGKLALVGGFLEAHETWQEGLARELREEAGVRVDPATFACWSFASTEPRPDRVLLFAVAETLDAASLPAFTPSTESTERGLVFGPHGLDDAIAFPLHVRALERYFAERGIAGACDYRPIG